MSLQSLNKLIAINTERLDKLEEERDLVFKMVEQKLNIPHRWVDRDITMIPTPTGTRQRAIVNSTFNEILFRDEVETLTLDIDGWKYFKRCLGH